MERVRAELVVWRVSRRLGTPSSSSWPGCRSCGGPGGEAREWVPPFQAEG